MGALQRPCVTAAAHGLVSRPHHLTTVSLRSISTQLTPSPSCTRLVFGRWEVQAKARGERGAMGRIFTVELEGRVYRCKFCRTPLALFEELVSRSFHCRRGKAYLFNNVVNVFAGELEDRMLLSGIHTVTDVFCCFCGQSVGWKYEEAHEKSQRYKEGKYVLERGRIVNGADFGFFLDTHQNGSDADDN